MKQSKMAIYFFCSIMVLGVASCEEELVRVPTVQSNDQWPSDLLEKLLGKWTIKSWTMIESRYVDREKSKLVAEINYGVTGAEYQTITSIDGVTTTKVGRNIKLTALVIRGSDGRIYGQQFPDGSNSGNLTLQNGWITVGVIRYKVIEITDTRLIVTKFEMIDGIDFQESTYTLTRPDGILPGPLKPNG